MTTAIIGTGGIGSVIARQLAAGGETLRLSSADTESARTLAAKIGHAAVVAAGNRDALQGADAVVLALRFTVLKGVIDQIADPLTHKLVVVPSNPLSTDAHGNLSRLLPKGQSSGEVVAGWLPAGARLAMAFGTLFGRSLGVLEPPVTGAGGPVLRDRRRPCWRGSRAVDPNGRLRAGEGRRARTVGPARGGRRPSRPRGRPRRGAVIDRWGLMRRKGRKGARVPSGGTWVPAAVSGLMCWRELDVMVLAGRDFSPPGRDEAAGADRAADRGHRHRVPRRVRPPVRDRPGRR